MIGYIERGRVLGRLDDERLIILPEGQSLGQVFTDGGRLPGPEVESLWVWTVYDGTGIPTSYILESVDSLRLAERMVGLRGLGPKVVARTLQAHGYQQLVQLASQKRAQELARPVKGLSAKRATELIEHLAFDQGMEQAGGPERSLAIDALVKLRGQVDIARLDQLIQQLTEAQELTVDRLVSEYLG